MGSALCTGRWWIGLIFTAMAQIFTLIILNALKSCKLDYNLCSQGDIFLNWAYNYYKPVATDKGYNCRPASWQVISHYSPQTVCRNCRFIGNDGPTGDVFFTLLPRPLIQRQDPFPTLWRHFFSILKRPCPGGVLKWRILKTTDLGGTTISGNFHIIAAFFMTHVISLYFTQLLSSQWPRSAEWRRLAARRDGLKMGSHGLTRALHDIIMDLQWYLICIIMIGCWSLMYRLHSTRWASNLELDNF